MSTQFIHLHTHSDYSLLRATATVKGMVQRAKQYEMSHIALTDLGNLFGILELNRECKKEGITPIIGCDFALTLQSRHERKRETLYQLVLLAMNEVGYQNLIHLSSLGYTEGFYSIPRIDDEVLTRHCDGLIAIAGGTYGMIGAHLRMNNYDLAKQMALKYRALFGADRFFLELQDHNLPDETTINAAMKELAQQIKSPLVATNNCFYLDKDDAIAREMLIAIGRRRKHTGNAAPTSHEFYFKNGEEMAALFQEYPDAIENTLRIAEMCTYTISERTIEFPQFQLPAEAESADHYLRELAEKGLHERYPNPTEREWERLNRELKVIIGESFTGYFLIIYDLVNYARTHGIPVGPGRGSGVGSLVAYCLRITNIEPLQYGLLFERFLNTERRTLPDFDVDFCFKRRGEIIEYITHKYGADHVGQIITFGRLKARAVIRDLARVLDIPISESDRITKLIPDGSNVTLNDAIANSPELKQLESGEESYVTLINIGRKLEGLCRHVSTHAAGIVIGRKPLLDYLPLYCDRSGQILTQFTMEYLEYCGLIKIDILGLKTLTLIQKTTELIAKEHELIDMDTIPYDDEATFKMLSTGESNAIFQFENPGMQKVLTRAKPNCIKDMIALTSLYRPGPMENIDQYIETKNGTRKMNVPLPQMEAILAETHGVIIYQEQVMEIGQVVANFTLGEADTLRYAMGKKVPEQMAIMHKKFVEGAKENGIDKKKADNLFELMKPFAGYGFNKSHATAYAVLAYQTAWLKTHYPAQFMAANLTNEINDANKFTQYINELRRLNIPLLPPDINRSEKEFSIRDDSIIFGMIGIKNVGSSAVEEMIRARNEAEGFKTFEQLLQAINLKTVGRKTLELCIQAGLFDSLNYNRATLIKHIDILWLWAQSQYENRISGQSSLFGEGGEDKPYITILPELDIQEQLAYEKSHLGLYFSGHPLDIYKKAWEHTIGTVKTNDPSTWPIDDRPHTIIGVVANVRSITDRRNRRFGIITIADYNGEMEALIFEDELLKAQPLLEEEARLAFSLNFQKSRRDIESVRAVIRSVEKAEKIYAAQYAEIHIALRNDFQNHEELRHELKELRASLHNHNGRCPIYFHIDGNDDIDPITILSGDQVQIVGSKSVLEYIEQQQAVSKVWTK